MSDKVKVYNLDPNERLTRNTLYNELMLILENYPISFTSKYHVVCMVKHKFCETKNKKLRLIK